MLKLVLTALAIIVVLIVSSASIGNIAFGRKANSEARQMFQTSRQPKTGIITQDDIRDLPEPAQRYLRYAQIIGKERIRTVRLKQSGIFRTKKDRRWMPIEAVQYYTVDPPAFVWRGTIKPFPLFSISGRDKFQEGRGHMLIKLLSLIKVADAKGEEMDQGALVRYLNEIFWFPTAYLSDYIRWEPIDSVSAKATISVEGDTASAVLYFGPQGELTNFVADRYMAVEGKFVKERWSTPISEYKEISGFRVPVKGEAVWKLSSGDFSYFKLEITDIEYDNPSVY